MKEITIKKGLRPYLGHSLAIPPCSFGPQPEKIERESSSLSKERKRGRRSRKKEEKEEDQGSEA